MDNHRPVAGTDIVLEAHSTVAMGSAKESGPSWYRSQWIAASGGAHET
jgi:hypothetical protein